MVITIFPAVLTFFLVLFPIVLQGAMFETFILHGCTCHCSSSTASWPPYLSGSQA
jgi:hypothetical protein